VQDIAALWVYRKDWSGRILVTMIPGAIVGVAAAGLLAAHISNDAVRVFIAVFTLAFVTYNWIGPARVAKEVAKEGGNGSRAAGVFWGALSGFTSTICQAGAPPYQMYVLSQHLTKMTFVGTTAIFFAAVNWLKVGPYIALGQFSATGIRTSLVLLPLAVATNLLGFWAVRVTPQQLFFRITHILLFLISLELLRSGIAGILRG
jgi:uncharacterized membrane protein YfcA